MKIAERQRYALTHPVETPYGSDSRPYTQIVHRGTLRLSTILMIERRGDGGYTWHSSVAILGTDGKPIPFFGNVITDDFDTAMNVAVEMIDDVGTGELSTIKPDAVIHLFKNLSAEETAIVRRRSVRNN